MRIIFMKRMQQHTGICRFCAVGVSGTTSGRSKGTR